MNENHQISPRSREIINELIDLSFASGEIKLSVAVAYGGVTAWASYNYDEIFSHTARRSRDFEHSLEAILKSVKETLSKTPEEIEREAKQSKIKELQEQASGLGCSVVETAKESIL